MTDLLAYVRRNALPCAVLLLVLAVGLGGGYALAASKTKTITVCADKGTGILHLKTHGGRCKRGQTRVTWNQVGPQGPQGFQGPAGQPGAPAVSVWANVTNAGSLGFGSGALGTAPLGRALIRSLLPPRRVPTDPTHRWLPSRMRIPRADSAGAFPVAWYGSTGINQQFMVFTGVVVSGSFTPTDHTFTVMDTCM